MKLELTSAGAVGGPKWGVGPVRPEQGLLRIRKELGLYANIRPASFASESWLEYSPLKEEVARGFEVIVVRELIGGICECSDLKCYPSGKEGGMRERLRRGIRERRGARNTERSHSRRRLQDIAGAPG